MDNRSRSRGCWSYFTRVWRGDDVARMVGHTMSRTGQQRLDAIVPAIERRDAFRERVAAAEGDAVRCADLMAEAITMKIESNGMEAVGRNGKVTVSMENVCASHCLIYARDAYLKARGSNAAGQSAP